VYFVIGLLAMQLAFSIGKTTDRNGPPNNSYAAVRKILLGVVAVGLIAAVFWRHPSIHRS